MLKSNSNKGKKKKQNAGNRSGAGSVGMSAVCRPTKEWSFVPWWQIFDLIYQRSSQLDEAKPNQPAISPSLCMDICRYFPRDTQTTHSISSYSESTHCKIFFYKYPQKTLICNEVAVPSQRGHRERQDKLWEAEGLVSLLPPLAIPPILLVGTVRAVKSWTAATEPMAACSGWGIACVRRWLDCIISIILLGFTLGIEALALIWN